MSNLAVKAIILVMATVVLLVLGGYATFKLSGSNNLTGKLCARGDARPLYLRFGGYDSEDVIRHWGSQDDKAHMIEQRLLKWDILFPFLYGAALTTSLLRAHSPFFTGRYPRQVSPVSSLGGQR